MSLAEAAVCADAIIEADLLISGGTDHHHGRRSAGCSATARWRSEGDRIVAVGRREDLARTVRAKRTIDGSRFVVTPGFVDGHIHITGDPLTRGFTRGGPGEGPSQIMSRWVIPIFRAQTPADEAISAQCAAVAMMRGGTTTFLEAGTVTHLDAVMDGAGDPPASAAGSASGSRAAPTIRPRIRPSSPQRRHRGAGVGDRALS